jgi:hypothetical protein
MIWGYLSPTNTPFVQNYNLFDFLDQVCSARLIKKFCKKIITILKVYYTKAPFVLLELNSILIIII